MTPLDELPEREPDPEISVIEERRLGRFSIPDIMIQEAPSEVRAVLSDVIVTKTHWWDEVTEYLGYCRHFEPVEEGVMPPIYTPIFTTHEDGSTTHEWQKREVRA